jgi:hypothetical protein
MLAFINETLFWSIFVLILSFIIIRVLFNKIIISELEPLLLLNLEISFGNSLLTSFYLTNVIELNDLIDIVLIIICFLSGIFLSSLILIKKIY